MATFAVWASGAAALARAQAPASGRALRIVCASPPGGTPDVIARHYAGRLGGAANSGAVVDNRPGAAGLLAVSALKQAPADGSVTLLGHSGLATMYDYLYPRLPYDPLADLVPVAPAAETAFGLAVGPAVPADVRRLGDYAGWARADATRATYGSPGNGTLAHIMGALLARAAGFESQHVAYVGGPQAIADLLGGRLASVVLPEGLLQPLHQAGKLRVLAVSGAARAAAMAEVPTLVEEGYPALVLREWWGFFAPQGTPAAAVAGLAQAFGAAAAMPENGIALAAAGLQGVAGTSAQMGARIARERDFWRAVLPTTGIRLG